MRDPFWNPIEGRWWAVSLWNGGVVGGRVSVSGGVLLLGFLGRIRRTSWRGRMLGQCRHWILRICFADTLELAGPVTSGGLLFGKAVWAG